MPLPGIGEGFFALTKQTILSAFLALPIILLIVTVFFATTTANVGMMVLFFGQAFGVPALMGILQLIRGIGFLQKWVGWPPTLTYKNYNKLCSLSPADVKDDQYVPPISYWLAHVVYFGTFVMTNAYTVYAMDSPSANADPIKVENRKAQMLTAMGLTGAILVFLIYQHYNYVGCDTAWGLIGGTIFFGGLGYGFFKLAEVCGIRKSDLFGVATKMQLPSPGDNQFPYACVNIKGEAPSTG